MPSFYLQKYRLSKNLHGQSNNVTHKISKRTISSTCLFDGQKIIINKALSMKNRLILPESNAGATPGERLPETSATHVNNLSLTPQPNK